MAKQILLQPPELSVDQTSDSAFLCSQQARLQEPNLHLDLPLEGGPDRKVDLLSTAQFPPHTLQ